MNADQPTLRPLSPAQVKARLQWETACERLGFVLNPPAGMQAPGPEALATAVEVVRQALAALESAFASESDLASG